MGPRSVTADRVAPLAGLSIGQQLQWGRGLSPRIGEGRRPGGASPRARFNGAAVCHRGSEQAQSPLPERGREASMGPRSVTADRGWSAERLSYWLRRFNGAAVCHRGSGRFCRSEGWSPHSFNGAAVCHRGSAEFMGMMLDSLGKLQWGRGLSPRIGWSTSNTPRRAWGFNGAAVCHRGSASVSSTASGSSSGLQWGRGLSPRIGACCLCCWGEAAAASMGPRSVTADRFSRKSLQPSGFFSFNGAAVCHRGSARQRHLH